MATVAFRLSENFFPQDVIAWYHQAAPRDMAMITLPRRACRLQLVRGYQSDVVWWPQGERSVTVTLENAMQRLEMLRYDNKRGDGRYGDDIRSAETPYDRRPHD